MAEVNASTIHHGNGRGLAPSGTYLTVREAAEVLSMHFMSVYKLVQTGRLPALKIGHRWKIDPGELDDWLARHRQCTRGWLLVGAAAGRADRLAGCLGPHDRLRVLDFGDLAAALADEPDVVLIDAVRDHHAALAALGLARRRPHPPLAALLIDPDDRAALEAALGQGVVTLVAWPPSAAAMEQLTALLHWT